MYDKTDLKAAMLTLVQDDNAAMLHKYLLDAVAIAGKLPIKLTDVAAPMNPLLWLAQTNHADFERRLGILDQVRAQRGLPPLMDSGFKKNPYMADFMSQGRHRRGRASALENLDRPDRDKLRGNARLEFERTVQATWKKQLDALVTKARSASPAGRLSKPDMDALRARFWAGVDTALEEKEADSKRRM